MPTLEPMVLVAWFVTALFAGAGWTLGCWIMNRTLTAIFNRPAKV